MIERGSPALTAQKRWLQESRQHPQVLGNGKRDKTEGFSQPPTGVLCASGIVRKNEAGFGVGGSAVKEPETVK